MTGKLIKIKTVFEAIWRNSVQNLVSYFKSRADSNSSENKNTIFCNIEK